MSNQRPEDRQEPPTTGHEWDGIREYDNPMPRWWLLTLYACIIWGIGYMIAYPAWPMINGATKGVLGYSTRGEVAAEIAAVDAANAGINARLAAADLATIAEDPELAGYARSAGAAVFRTFCAQCHGSGAAGSKGYPNLLDDDWLWGGDIAAIQETIRHGIRAPEDDDTRFSQMPAFGEFMESEEISQVVNYVMSLSGTPEDATSAAAGQVLYSENCSACHGDAGKGDREQGAPDLTDQIWLFGGDYAALTDTITNARYGVMPSWATRLSEAQVNAVAAYVHQLGGGE